MPFCIAGTPIEMWINSVSVYFIQGHESDWMNWGGGGIYEEWGDKAALISMLQCLLEETRQQLLCPHKRKHIVTIKGPVKV